MDIAIRRERAGAAKAQRGREGPQARRTKTDRERAKKQGGRPPRGHPQGKGKARATGGNEHSRGRTGDGARKRKGETPQGGETRKAREKPEPPTKATKARPRRQERKKREEARKTERKTTHKRERPEGESARQGKSPSHRRGTRRDARRRAGGAVYSSGSLHSEGLLWGSTETPYFSWFIICV